MKVTAACLFLVMSFVLFSNSIMAQETNAVPSAVDSPSPEAMKFLVTRALDHRYFSINDILDMQAASKFMLTNEKTAFFERYSINGGMMTGAFFMNLLLPGSGNLALGDVGGGLALMLPTLGGVAFYAIVLLTTGAYWAPAGLAVYLFTEPFGWILPFTYAAGWNHGLKTALRLVDPDTKTKVKPMAPDRTSFNGRYDVDRTIEFQLASFSF